MLPVPLCLLSTTGQAANAQEEERNLILLTSASLRISACNVRWKELTKQPDPTGQTLRVLLGSGSDEQILPRLFGGEWEVSARLWHYTGEGEPFVNHVTTFPLVAPSAEDGNLQISHYLGVMRGQMLKQDTPKPVADKLRQLLVKANVLGLSDEDDEEERTMCHGQSIVNRDIALPPSGRRVMLLEAQAKLSEEAGWNQVSYGKTMHLKMMRDHEAYQAIQRRMNALPNGTEGGLLMLLLSHTT